ncbi:hypothetical protein [Nitrospirillum iridis]|uniref:Glycosyltransferase RgtA/B/C/D-like domain-containing protein n=1 Tax=Nitrospirillum iridis TaxID=765888 RepID=A0A7X0ECJ0_9PROT|nr:hypothetical protein [Nitrospirillum iridis]MBB6251698.1 hypothetical protein [Nitrospirillum iridis]
MNSNSWYVGTRRRISIAIILIAVIALVFACLKLTSNRQMFEDEIEYIGLSSRIINNHAYISANGEPTAFRPPGYPILISPLIALNVGIFPVQLMQIVLLAISAWIVSRLAVKFFGEVAGPVAAILCVANPGLAGLAVTLFPQLVMAFLLAIIFYFSVDVSKFKSILGSCCAWGVLNIVNPMLAPLSIAHLLWLGRGSTHVVRILSLFIACAPIGGWIFRNWEVFGVPVIGTNTGINLIIGNAPWSNVWQGVSNADGPIFDTLLGLSELEVNKRLVNFVVDRLWAEPFHAIWNYINKFVSYFRLYDDITISNGGINLAQMAYSVFFVILISTSLFSLKNKKWRGSVPLLIIICAIIYFDASYSIFFNRIRFRLPLDILLAIPASGGITELMRSWKAARIHH